MNKALFSSASDEWATPQALFDRLNEKFRFDLDVCATKENAKCARYYTREQDGLAQTWEGVCWMNPPYGRQIGEWMQKAYQAAIGGATVVCLVPARTDTRWWHEYAMRGEIEFLKGRLKFGGAKQGAPFPSALVIFRGGANDGECGFAGALHGDDCRAGVSGRHHGGADGDAGGGRGHLRALADAQGGAKAQMMTEFERKVCDCLTKIAAEMREIVREQGEIRITLEAIDRRLAETGGLTKATTRRAEVREFEDWGEYYCSACGGEVMRHDVYCEKCKAELIWPEGMNEDRPLEERGATEP